MKPSLKCLIWDLDDTLWQGTLLEHPRVALTPGVSEIVSELDRRGILQSVASRNDFDVAWRQIAAFGLDDYFLYPQIGWGSKSTSVRTIAEALGIGLDAVAFVDDQAFERDEVRHALPSVTTFGAEDIATLLHRPELELLFPTGESRMRRQMYRANIERRQAEASFAGTKTEFLATLGMRLTIRPAGGDDLARAEELTVRTNQLNTSGRTYDEIELRALIHSPDHLVLVADLEDRYGASGTIGLALIERSVDIWLLTLFITSCRVMSRGVGSIMLTQILQSARDCGVRLRAEFVPTSRNRIMYVTYKFNGFVEVGERAGTILLEHPLDAIRSAPAYVTVCVDASTLTISGV
jgi:FkbH-like protein